MLISGPPPALPTAHTAFRVLLLKPKHIGDSLLLTPTLVAIRRDYPKAEIWVVVRRDGQGILAGCPEIDRLLAVAPVDRHQRRPGDLWRGLRTLAQLSRPQFDYVFELGDGHRGRLLAWAAKARRCYSVRPATPFAPRQARLFHAVGQFDWETRHRVEKDFYSVAEFLPLAQPIPPLRFARERARHWLPAARFQRFALLQIGKRQAIGRWTREGWEQVGRALLEKLDGLVIASGPDPAEVADARWLQEKLGDRALPTEGRADWSQMAGLLYRARLYVGTDTATMHLAAACQCPAVALFGSTYEGHWRPWQSPHKIVAESDITPTADPKSDLARAKARSMSGITPAAVLAACHDMLQAREQLQP